jgi:cytochrome c-type biogenesis protein CcmH/NrfG
MAGIVNAVVFRGGHKLFMLGILLAAVPPVADYVMRQSALVISLTVLAISLMMLIYVAGKWFGWRALGQELKPLAAKAKDKRQDYTAEQAMTIIENANNERPKSLQTKIQGEIT